MKYVKIVLRLSAAIILAVPAAIAFGIGALIIAIKENFPKREVG